MKYIKPYHFIFLLIFGLLSEGCKEEIDIESIVDFESALVIEATITDELRFQEIKLSRAFKLDEEFPSSENNADVKIIDNFQNIFRFKEGSPGKYISVNEFSAEDNKNYQLQITTSDGRSYISEPSKLSNPTQIDKLYASREIDNFGNEGISIFVDSFDPSGNSKHYRYEYEETYKIVAPKWVLNDLTFVSDRPVFVPKTEEQQVCYNTVNSIEIIQTETINLHEDRVSKFSVRFIPRDNAIISYRYSILVKQYIQSFDAFTYYKTLNKMSGSESFFSQNQPGFISGNIVSVDDSNEKVIGFFEVSSVSYQRLFFNYHDFFPDEVLPPYFVSCEMSAPSFNFPDPELIPLINNGYVKYFSENPDYPSFEDLNMGPYLVVPIKCGDCTKLGTNIMPDFWEE